MFYSFCQTKFTIGESRPISQANEREQKKKNVPFNKWLEILAKEDLPPKETPLQWEQGFIVLTTFVAVLATKKCFWW